MADKNFTQFELRSPLIESDYLVGYKAGGSAEIRTTLRDILDLVPTPVLEIPQELVVNTVITENLITGNLRFQNASLIEGTALPSSAAKYIEVNINGQIYWLSLFEPITNQFLHSLVGPNNEDGEQKITIFSNFFADTILYNNWDNFTSSYTSTIVYVNGIERSNISHTVDRIGTQFGYATSGGSQIYLGTFNGGNVFFE